MEGNNFSDLGITEQPSEDLGETSVTGSTWVNKWHLKLAIIFYSLSLIVAILFLDLSCCAFSVFLQEDAKVTYEFV